MPATRRRLPNEGDFLSAGEDLGDDIGEDFDAEEEALEEENGAELEEEDLEHEDDDDDEPLPDVDAQSEDTQTARLPPAGLKEISSLASWTVSTSKPGCGVAALRSPDTSLFWQSDGPQPHLLSIHFFKLVPIVHMRIYLDWEADESYTPTKMQFLAGMGTHDVQEFAEMSFEQPKGWIDVDFTNVGLITDDPDEDEDDFDSEHQREINWDRRPVLRAFVVQVRILENHQNGKDTHLRGLQIFAKDETQTARITKPATQDRIMPVRAKPKTMLRKASWMMDPDLR